MSNSVAKQIGHSWRLYGLPRQVAVFGAVGFLVGGLLAVAIDVLATNSRDAATLQTWTLLPQIVTAAGLFRLGRYHSPTSLSIMALLVALIVVEEAFHVLNVATSFLQEVGASATDWSESAVRITGSLVLYSLIAIGGMAMIAIAFRKARPAERPALRATTFLLVAGGLFGGPFSALSDVGETRRWLYVEELGEAVVFAAMAGYVVGLLVRSRNRDRV